MNPQLPEALQRRVENFINDSSLPQEIVDELISHHTVVTYPKGSALFLQGSPADMFFWIFSGTVEVFCPRPNQQTSIDAATQIFELTRAPNVTLLTREHIFRVLQTLEPHQMIRLLEFVNTMWSAAANSWARFSGDGRRLKANDNPVD